MLGDIIALAVVGLAGFFYAITVYHVALIFIGLRITKGGRKPFDKGSLRNPVDLPKVSLIIPAKDEEVVIEGAVRCADRLQYPRDLLEILLVEDGSTDDTPTIGKRMAAVIPNVVCISGGESKGKPAALNRAIARASGEVIAIFDSDSRYAPDLLLRVAKYFHDRPDVDIAQAFPQVMNANKNVITRINYFETRFWFQGLQAAKERLGLFMHLAGTGMFIKRQVFEALGAWDEACLTEDLEYSVRVARSRFHVGMLDGDVWIQPTYRARHLVRQRKRWWAGAMQVFGKAVKQRFAIGASPRQRLDAFLYTVSPVVFLISSLLFGATLASFLLTGGVAAALGAFLVGILASNALLIPLVVGESVAVREPTLLWLIPGLYWYWLLQVVSLLAATGQLAFRPQKLIWERTPKIKVD